MVRVHVRNHHLRWDDVSGARLYLNPQAAVYPPPANPPQAAATTNASGVANLNISALAAGVHTLWIVPASSSNAAVGPHTGTGGAANRIWRGLRVNVSVGVTAGNVRMTQAVVHNATQNNGAVTADVGRQRLNVQIRPLWIESPYHRARNGAVDMIIVHRTGGAVIGPAINQFLNNPDGISCHYIIDRDGQIVKMVLDGRRAGHAGTARWGSQRNINDRAIGIENVGQANQALEAAQYQSLIRLIQDLMTHHGITRERVIGHSDVRTDNRGVLSNARIACPGLDFDWPQLEGAQGQAIGLRRQGGNPPANDPVAAFFTHMQQAGVANLALQRGDRDPRGNRPGRFGGANRPGVNMTPIEQLQTRLGEIGYSVGTPDGGYGNRTARAVLHFQTHFLDQGADEMINETIANLIRAVWSANPNAP